LLQPQIGAEPNQTAYARKQKLGSVQNLDCGPWTGLWTGPWTGLWTGLYYVLDERCASENWSDYTMASIDGEVSANPLQS